MKNIEEMEELAKAMGPFSPSAWFEPKMDQLVFHSSDESYDEVRVDEWLTVFASYENQRMVGFKLKGFNWLFRRAVVHGYIHEDGFLDLVDLLDYAWIIAVAKSSTDATSNLDPQYREAKEIADDYKINRDELPVAA